MVFLDFCLYSLKREAHPAMLSVNSGRQLCKMFFSLQVVFLSVVIVESSASNGNQNGNMTPSYAFSSAFIAWFHFKISCMENVMFCFVFYSTSHVMLLFSDCVRSSGVDYRGERQSSSSGLTCLNWTNTTRDYDVTEHPDSHTGKLLTLRGVFVTQILSNKKEYSVVFLLLMLKTDSTSQNKKLQLEVFGLLNA